MSPKLVQSDQIVAAARETGELFHDEDGNPYVDITMTEPLAHHEILRIRSRPFRTWLAGVYYRSAGRPASGQALTDALAVLAAVAQFDRPRREVGLRIAAHDGAIYLDLADPCWRVVEIDTAGWRLLDRSPIPFRRPRGMRALPEPVAGGSLEELRAFINVHDEDQFRLVAGWLVSSLRPSGPYIALVLTGEQDSAKSTTARCLRLLIDPNEVGDRTLPRDDQSFAIAASNSWVASFDNVSTLADWQSDAIARLATGAGFGTRQLYTDDEEYLVHVARPVVLNGIGGIVTRPDLMDRAIVVDLAAIPDDVRRPEDEFYSSFELARPRLLGSLLTAASGALDGHARVVIKRLPRMADATRWVTAAEGALGWPDGSFLAAYQANRTNSRSLTLDASPLAAPLKQLLDERDWSGTATELLKALEERVGQEVSRRRDWPKTAQQLGTDLRRLAPDLRRVERIEVTFPARHGSGRVISLVRERDPLSQPSPNAARDNGDIDLQRRTGTSARQVSPDVVDYVGRLNRTPDPDVSDESARVAEVAAEFEIRPDDDVPASASEIERDISPVSVVALGGSRPRPAATAGERIARLSKVLPEALRAGPLTKAECARAIGASPAEILAVLAAARTAGYRISSLPDGTLKLLEGV